MFCKVLGYQPISGLHINSTLVHVRLPNISYRGTWQAQYSSSQTWLNNINCKAQNTHPHSQHTFSEDILHKFTLYTSSAATRVCSPVTQTDGLYYGALPPSEQWRYGSPMRTRFWG